MDEREALILAALSWHLADDEADWLLTYRSGTYNDLLAALQARDAAVARLHGAARAYVQRYGTPEAATLSVAADTDSWADYLRSDPRYAPGRRSAGGVQ